MTLKRFAPLAAAALLAAGCGGGSGAGAPSYAVGGTVSGLAGAGLTLRLTGPSGTLQNLPVGALATTFQFTPHLGAGATWSVEVAPQPHTPSQTCVVAPSSGTVGAADVAVAVTCTTDAFSVGGTVHDLAPGSAVTLRNSTGEELVVAAPADAPAVLPFTFLTKVPSEVTFTVTVPAAGQPASPPQTCRVTNESGKVTSADVASVEVRCERNTKEVVGKLLGFGGATGVVLQVNGAFDKTLTADGQFAISNTLPAGTDFLVTVATQPTSPWQTCQVTAGASGTIDAAGATGVAVDCTTNAYSVGGTASGILRPGLTLSNNGGDLIDVDADGSFVFPTAVTSLQRYLVRVETSPASQVCVVTGFDGAVGGSAVSDVAVTCGCAPGLANCDGLPATGCETDTLSDASHCGGCATDCTGLFPNAGATCSNGTCQLGACVGGFGDCTGAPGCETNLVSDPAHCGDCTTACVAAPNAVAACASRTCTFTCQAGFGDCDGGAANGCEIDLTSTVLHCGDCLTACADPSHGTASCVGGACGLGACQAGFDDCDGNPLNGCEAELATDRLNCGACNVACSFPNASGACATSTCGLGTCDAGFADCDGQLGDGCEIDTRSDGLNCNGCGNVCALPHADPSCGGSACNTAHCVAGYSDCNGLTADGCEVSTADDPANCGGCNRACNSDRVCSAGSCTIATSCRDLLLQHPSAASGVYTIDPDGSGPGGTVQVYCEMTFAGGGWTFFAHMNEDYQADDLFQTDKGTYDPSRADTGTTYGRGGSVYQHLGATELMVSIINPDPGLTLGKSLIFYRFGAGPNGFTQGPVPSIAGTLPLEYALVPNDYQPGEFINGDTTEWLTFTAGGEPLIWLLGGFPFGTGLGSGIDPSLGTVTVDSNPYDSWWYAR